MGIAVLHPSYGSALRGSGFSREAFKRLRRHLSGQALPALALPH